MPRYSSVNHRNQETMMPVFKFQPYLLDQASLVALASKFALFKSARDIVK